MTRHEDTEPAGDLRRQLHLEDLYSELAQVEAVISLEVRRANHIRLLITEVEKRILTERGATD